MHPNANTLKTVLIATAITGLLAGCNDPITTGNVPDPVTPPPPAPVTYAYDVAVTNLTNAQPLSPVAVVLHNEGALWTVGESSSEALEILAEGGDNSALLGLDVAQASASGEAPVAPGATETLSVSIEDNADSLLSVVTMLVNTNDAFTGLTALDLSSLEVGDVWTGYTHSYDAGTELNDEAAGTIPGPADGGEGYNAERDDVGFVALHPGVVGMQDGLGSSVLTQAHRFDNPTIKITVTRTE